MRGNLQTILLLVLLLAGCQSSSDAEHDKAYADMRRAFQRSVEINWEVSEAMLEDRIDDAAKLNEDLISTVDAIDTLSNLVITLAPRRPDATQYAAASRLALDLETEKKKLERELKQGKTKQERRETCARLMECEGKLQDAYNMRIQSKPLNRDQQP